MEPVSTTPRSVRRKRRILALVLFVIASSIGVLVVRRQRLDPARNDSSRLDLLYAAWAEFNANHHDRATSMLDRRASEVEPTPLDWMLRARIAEAEGRSGEALDFLKRIPDTDPIAAQAWLKAGQIELTRNHALSAEAAYRRSLEIDPDLLQPYRELAYLYALQRREAECDAQFRALAERMPLDYILAFAWCQNYCRIWDPDASGKVLSRFVAEDPSDRWSRLALATSNYMSNRLDEAEATLRELPDSDPDALTMRVQLAIFRGDLQLAEDLARAGPDDHARLNIMRGQLAMYGSDPRRAATFYRAAFRQAPEDRDAIHGLGTALRLIGDPGADDLLEFSSLQDQLRRAIVDSVVTIESDPQLYFKLGRLCDSLNRRREARVWYQLAIGRDPLDTQAQEALARLDRAHSAIDADPMLDKDGEN